MNELSAVGVMSGSSLDGLDICYCDYKYFESKWQFQNLKGETIPFPRDIYALLLKARDLSGEELVKLDVRLGIWMGQMIRDFCQRHNYRPQIRVSWAYGFSSSKTGIQYSDWQWSGHRQLCQDTYPK